MFERPRGTRDFGPADAAKHVFVEQSLRTTSQRFGFREILTPTFESTELFKVKSGPGVLEEMFTFTDKSGRQLALRPEFTASVIRFFLSDLRNEPKPLKVFTMGSCFRYEEPQKGRYREFFQWNCEIIGASSLEADAETIALAVAGLKGVGLVQTETRIGHIGMLRKFLHFPPEVQARLLHLLDKKKLTELEIELQKLGAGDLHGPLSSVVKMKGGVDVLDRALEVLGDAAKEPVDYLRRLGEQLALHGVTGFSFDLGVVRGLDYYTGMVFEIDSPNLGAEKQVGGGGAYTLTEILGGEPTSTTGFAIGMDRVVLSAEEERVPMAPKPLDAYIIPIGPTTRSKAYEVLGSLRAAGLAADIDLMGRGPSKNLDYANAMGARRTVLVGEREVAKGVVTVRDMESGEQTEVAVEQVATVLKASSGNPGSKAIR